MLNPDRLSSIENPSDVIENEDAEFKASSINKKYLKDMKAEILKVSSGKVSI